MGYFLGLIALAVIVIVLAYALGRYLRERGELPHPPAAARRLNRPLPATPLGQEEPKTQALIDWLLTQAFEQTGVKVANDRLAYERIVEAAQKALAELKDKPSTTISLPFLTADATGPKHFEVQLTRGVMDELSRY